MALLITNRELLRNYRSLKERLLTGELDKIVVEQEGGRDLSIQLEQSVKTGFEWMLAELEEGGPLSFLKRPKGDLFDPI